MEKGIGVGISSFFTVLALIFLIGGGTGSAFAMTCTTPLIQAIQDDDVGRVRQLLDNGEDPNIAAYTKTFGTSKVFVGCAFSDSRSTPTINTPPNLANLEKTDPYGIYSYWEIAPLTVAINIDDPAIVKLLLDHGAVTQGNENNPAESSPLYWAVQKGDEAIVKLLLAHGADRNVKDFDGDTVSDVARKNKHPEIADLIDYYAAHHSFPSSTPPVVAQSSPPALRKRTSRRSSKRPWPPPWPRRNIL
ncbi:MAG: ankyrin repeat domain-containing protein [Sulfobacillus sp.]